MNYQTSCDKCDLIVSASTESALDKAMEKHYKTQKHQEAIEYVPLSPLPGPKPGFRYW